MLTIASFATVATAAGKHSGGHDNKGHGTGIHKGGHKQDGHHGHATDIGAPGDPGKVDRTITVVMVDNYFGVESIKVNKGETIRFIIRNDGEFLHEFNIGTPAMHAKHQEEMAMMVEHGMITATSIDHAKIKMDHGDGKMMMAHDDPNSVLLAPGEQGEIIWHFKQVIELEYGCNVPGHYDSGMVGPLHVDPTPKKTS